MTVFKVKSSNILQIEHIDTSLIVYFKGGGIYQYKDVPESIATDMVNAESAGKFLNKNIKSQYDFTKITETDVIGLRTLEKVVFYKVALAHDLTYYIIVPYSRLLIMFGEDISNHAFAIPSGTFDFVSGRLLSSLPSTCKIQKTEMTFLEFEQLKDHKYW